MLQQSIIKIFATRGITETIRTRSIEYLQQKGEMKQKTIERKISETFIDFSMPLLDAIGDGATKQQFDSVLRITYSVWNAVNFDSIKNGTKYVMMLRQAMEKDFIGSTIIEELILRKRNEFGADLRLIGEYSLKMVKGEMSLRAEVRNPSGIAY
jgi:hypothetical protein